MTITAPGPGDADRLEVVPPVEHLDGPQLAPEAVDTTDAVDTGKTVGTGPGDGPAVITGPALLVSSQGGHLTQLLVLESWWGDRPRLWVCPDSPDVADRLTGERVVASYSPTTRNVGNLARNFLLALRVLRRERPQIVISAGAGVAVPFFVMAWLLRIPTVFIEVYDRVDTPTLTGRLCGPFTTRRIVQWDQQLAFYPDARLVGPLL